MKSIFFWGSPLNMDRQFGNPYARLLREALARYGVTMTVAATLNLWEHIWDRDVRVLHFNWIAPHYTSNRWYTAIPRALSFSIALVVAYLRGYRIVWTMHNLYPHEMPFPWIDRLIRLLMCRLAYAVITHCQHAAGLAAQHFGRYRSVHIIPHGDFIEPYPNTISPEEARQSLDLSPEHFVYLFVGNIRPYKGVESLLATYTRLEDPDTRLVIAGKIHRSYGDTFQADTQGDPRILLRSHPAAEGIPADEMQRYLNAADVVVLPFLDTLTSGSAILSLGFSRPVIAPGVGCLTELLKDHGCGILYEPGSDEGLLHALQLARSLNLPVAQRRARQRAESLGWDQIGQSTVLAYGGDLP